MVTKRTVRNPPMVVKDLFEDIKDGIVLIALLEVLSGQKLPCEQGRKLKRIHGVANIGTALKFLEGRRIKLVNINSTDIADGRPSIVLGLVWTIILYFQVWYFPFLKTIKDTLLLHWLHKSASVLPKPKALFAI
ncbi:spectrin beta chain-like [Notechis scutatus]|uniref:Spectrin beta chain-like n=1 Tax=Notechis scutatus TaxID=8663 RepID=A0A6J1V042_9SAUR|nr:spectrin beta chain-like [Notechis scutatus]